MTGFSITLEARNPECGHYRAYRRIHPARAADTGWSGSRGSILAEGLPMPREQFVEA